MEDAKYIYKHRYDQEGDSMCYNTENIELVDGHRSGTCSLVHTHPFKKKGKNFRGKKKKNKR